MAAGVEEESSSDEEEGLDEDLKAAHLEEWQLAEEESETSVVAAACKPSPAPSPAISPPQVSDDEGEDALDRGVGTLVDQRQWWARRSRMTVSGRIAAWNIIIQWRDGQMITPDIMRYGFCAPYNVRTA